MTNPVLPASCEPHQPKYKSDAWKNYDVAELGGIVAFFLKRAGHRTDPVAARKDVKDAQNYLNMAQAHVDAARDSLPAE